SSQAAQSLMQRAIVSTAWKPLSPPNGAAQTNAAALPRGANTARLPSSQDWNTSASPPPLPGAMNTANATNATNAANVATAASPAGGDNSVDAQQRAIVQNGWKHAAPPGTAH
ncbi:MAG TPA: hypothetical protein VJU59_49705, partial [Paraburkholderia sp.]|nr:hypothetical protein [Paraburkholderia sp.]